MNFSNKKVFARIGGVLVVVLVGGYFGLNCITASAIERQFPQFSGMAMGEVETIAAGNDTEASDKTEAVDEDESADKTESGMWTKTVGLWNRTADNTVDLYDNVVGDDDPEAEAKKAAAAAAKEAAAAAILSARHYLGLLHLSGKYKGPEKLPLAQHASVESLEENKEKIVKLIDKGKIAAVGLAVFAAKGLLIPDPSGATQTAAATTAGVTAATALALWATGEATKLAIENWPTLVRVATDFTGTQPDIGQVYWAAVKTTRDAEAAVWTWKLAAESGYAEPQYWLGQAYRYGYGATTDQAKAAELICDAAEKVEEAKYACDEMSKQL